MANILNSDFSDFLLTLNQFEVEYIMVGGYAVIFHGYQRTTGDLDIWVNQTASNYKKLVSAFRHFGLSVFDMTEVKFLNTNDFDVFTFGRSPVSIDILTKVKGLEFEECYEQSLVQPFDNIEVRMIDFRDLIKAKKAANRFKDLNDIEHLTRNKSK